MATVAGNPAIGECRKGDLAALHVFTFRALGQRCLLGCTVDAGVCLVDLEAVGPHESSYRDLKR